MCANRAKKITLHADKIKIAFSTTNVKDAKRSLSLTETIPHPQPNVTGAACKDANMLSTRFLDNNSQKNIHGINDKEHF